MVVSVLWRVVDNGRVGWGSVMMQWVPVLNRYSSLPPYPRALIDTFFRSLSFSFFSHFFLLFLSTRLSPNLSMIIWSSSFSSFDFLLQQRGRGGIPVLTGCPINKGNFCFRHFFQLFFSTLLPFSLKLPPPPPETPKEGGSLFLPHTDQEIQIKFSFPWLPYFLSFWTPFHFTFNPVYHILSSQPPFTPPTPLPFLPIPPSS